MSMFFKMGYRFSGYKALKKAFTVAPDIAMAASYPAMKVALDFLYHSIPPYPPPIGYKRTGRLGRGWETEITVEKNRVKGWIGNDVPYAPWVVGRDYPGRVIDGKRMYQARVHVDRWWQFHKVMAENRKEAWEKFTDVFWDDFLKAMNKEARKARDE